MATITQCAGTLSSDPKWRAWHWIAKLRSGLGIKKLVPVSLVRWSQSVRQRRELAEMTELELQDVGMTPSDRAWLTNLPFWKSWRQSNAWPHPSKTSSASQDAGLGRPQTPTHGG